ncbi:hypothetical protein ACFE04_008540 [Oxalis oulophora]
MCPILKIDHRQAYIQEKYRDGAKIRTKQQTRKIAKVEVMEGDNESAKVEAKVYLRGRGGGNGRCGREEVIEPRVEGMSPTNLEGVEMVLGGFQSKMAHVEAFVPLASLLKGVKEILTTRDVGDA